MIKVLIPYGTTEGLTARISEYVADVIRGHATRPTQWISRAPESLNRTATMR